MPPSRHVNDAAYDDRMERVLRTLAGNELFDIRLLLRQRASTTAAHLALKTGDTRPSLDGLIKVMEVDEAAASPAPLVVGVFDDVLTKGTHFRAAKWLLQQRFGQSLSVVGTFVARTVFLDDPANDPEFS